MLILLSLASVSAADIDKSNQTISNSLEADKTDYNYESNSILKNTKTEINTKTTTSNITTLPYHETQFNAKIEDDYGNGISEGKVQFFINGNTFVGSSEVSNGTASLTKNISYTPNNYVIKVKYLGTKSYLGSDDTGYLTVNQINTSVVMDSNMVVKSLDNYTFVANVVDEYGNSVNVGSVVFYINGNTYMGTSSVRGGVASFTKNIVYTANVYRITAKYVGTKYFADSSDTQALQVTKINTNSQLNSNMVVKSLSNYTFVANVVDEYGNSVNVGSVVFYINGNTYMGTSSVRGGVASFTKNIVYTANVYRITAKYVGTKYFADSSDTQTLKITQINTIATYNQQNAKTANNLTFTAKVVDENNNPINNGEVMFTINNGTYIGTANVINGVASFTKTIYYSPSSYTITATYLGNNYYLSSNNTNTLKVTSDTSTQISLGIPDENHTVIYATVRDANNNLVNSGTVSFIFDGNNKTITLKNGVATLNNSKILKNMTIKAIYNANSNYLSSSVNYNFIVKKDSKTSVTSLTSKNVYLTMDRTFGYNNYAAANVELLNNVITILKDAGFNIKYSKIGPSYVYDGAMHMYYNNVRDSIYFTLCNGADVDVFYEFITYNDNRITAMRSRNNTVVLGFFYECGDFYNEGGKYYTRIGTAHDGTGRAGTMYYPRKKMEDDGIKLIYQVPDKTAKKAARAFVDMFSTPVINTKINTETTITAKIIDNDYNKISGGTVTFKIGDTVIGTGTVSNGVANIKYKTDSTRKTYTVSAEYSGNSVYNPSITQFNLVVN